MNYYFTSYLLFNSVVVKCFLCVSNFTLHSTAKLISAFAFVTRIVQSLYFLNPKFQASNHIQRLYSLVCVGSGRKPRRPVTAKLISAFAFVTQIVQSLYFLNPKFQTSNHIQRLYSLVCVGPGRKPRRPVFSQRGSNGLLPLQISAGDDF